MAVAVRTTCLAATSRINFMVDPETISYQATTARIISLGAVAKTGLWAAMAMTS